MNGFVVLDKAPGETSFHASSFLRKLYNEKKTGHTGTLDPMATGVLPVAVGSATRLIPFLPDEEKGYTARLRLGIVTDTLDITGKVLETRAVSATKVDFERVLPSFLGDILQTPSMYSALSVDGKRLYALARQGVEIERKARPVRICRLELTGCFDDNEYEIDVVCSKGTYIRSLAADIGEALGCGAALTALRRTASNGFTLENAVTEETLKTDPAAYLLPADEPFAAFPAVYVTQKQAVRFMNGGDLLTERLKGQPAPAVYRVYAPDGGFLGLGEIPAEKPETMLVKRVLGG